MSATRTTCAYCGVGCGILAETRADGSVAISGDPQHPANFGRLCSKGAALGETLDLQDRLLAPQIGARVVDWPTALGHVAARFAETIAAHGPDSVAFYVSGQLLTEDYYLANKLMKGFIGAANIDTNSRLCMASSVAGHRRAFGADVVPGCYEDLEQADLIVLVGSNLAWCHPVLFQRILAARAGRPEMRIVAIDPRGTDTTAAADLHLAARSDSDVAIFNGLLAHLADAGALDPAYIAAHTEGFAQALAVARAADAAAASGVAPEQLARFYAWFAATPRVVTIYSQGVNQSVSGTDKVNAIINCHLATGRIGRPGMGPFSVTGQPNAMGGREVGGLANQLACHLELEDPAHRALVGGFWQSPGIASRPGLKAVDLFEAVAQGRIKALWIMATNPVVSMPDADRVRAALAACPFVVVSEVVTSNDTLPYAHVRLPAAAWGEKDGTVTNSERRISRQRAFLPLPGAARPDWWIIAEVARRMGFAEAFNYAGAAEIFAEYATLAGLAAGGVRPLDLAGLAELDTAGYAALAPTQWPRRRDGGAAARLFADGVFATPHGRARFVATPAVTSPAEGMVLNTGRVRDHWHTMTRTGLAPRLSAHIGEPYLDIAPDDAAARGITPASIVRVQSSLGHALLRARITAAQLPGTVFAPMHWSDANASQARIDALVAPRTDPISGQPGLKRTQVTISPAGARWYGFAVLRQVPAEFGCAYWAAARTAGGFRLELAGLAVLDDPAGFARALLGAEAGGEMLAYHDARRGRHRFAAFLQAAFIGAIYIAPEPVDVARAWVAAALATPPADAAARYRLLAGQPGGDAVDEGPTICACAQVGRNRIAGAIAGGAATLQEIGARTSAGANCGSCRPEIRRMLDAAGKLRDVG